MLGAAEISIFSILFRLICVLGVGIVIAKCIGSFLPLFAHKIKLDPAVMASPIITTAVDIIVLVVYFGLAKILLGI